MSTTSENSIAQSAAPPGNSGLVRGYRPELDAVRFLAFFLVFVHHLLLLSPSYQAGEALLASEANVSWHVRIAFAEACGMGLCLFFALSAYLITSLLLNERSKYSTISVRKFYIRRALRIWPLYFLGVALGIGIAVAMRRTDDTVGFVWYLLFAGNIYCGVFGWLHNPMTPLWSISIEEQFYLIWPWAMRWLTRRNLRICAAAFITVANITLFFYGRHHVETDITVWTSTLVQFEMFAVGILIALSERLGRYSNFGMGVALVIAGPVLWFLACFSLNAKMPAVYCVRTGSLSLMLGYGLVALACGAVLQGFCMIGASRIPRWAASLGKISYGLYVYHVLAVDFALAIFGSKHGIMPFVASFLLAFVLTVAAATISYTYIETPFLRLKRRFELVHSRPI